MGEKFDVMVAVAHPDDAELGAAGSVARWVDEGRSVVFVVCTSGEKGSSDRDMRPETLAKIREGEQRAAARALGLGKVVFLRMPDQQLEETAAFRETIVRQIRQDRPERVVTMDPYRRYLWHRDHRIVGQVVMDAIFPLARDHMAYPDMLEEGLEPHKVKEVLFFGAEEPNHYIDITETFPRAVSALECHQSQMQGLGVADVTAWLRERRESMAEGTSFELAEGFHRVQMPS